MSSTGSAGGAGGAHDAHAVGDARGSGDAGPQDFDGILRHLRRLAAPCEPPVGVGSFELLYASEREVVVWYSPARDYQQQGEVAIPCARLAAAWAALAAGESLDAAALEARGGGVGGGRWLLALLAQLPGVRVREEPLTVVWDPQRIEATPAAVPVPVPVSTGPTAGAIATATTSPVEAPGPGARQRRARAGQTQP